jgi:rhodanese-related sulfurtransferase
MARRHPKPARPCGNPAILSRDGDGSEDLLAVVDPHDLDQRRRHGAHSVPSAAVALVMALIHPLCAHCAGETRRRLAAALRRSLLISGPTTRTKTRSSGGSAAISRRWRRSR